MIKSANMQNPFPFLDLAFLKEKAGVQVLSFMSLVFYNTGILDQATSWWKLLRVGQYFSLHFLQKKMR